MSRSFITVKKTSTKIIEEDLYFDLYLGQDIRNFIKEEEYMSFDDIFEKVFDGVFFNFIDFEGNGVVIEVENNEQIKIIIKKIKEEIERERLERKKMVHEINFSSRVFGLFAHEPKYSVVDINDEGFKVGDFLKVKEMNEDTKEYTGQEMIFLIMNIEPRDTQDNSVFLELKRCSKSEFRRIKIQRG